MLKGIVVFRNEDKGSKSEGLKPFLYTGMGEFFKIFLEGSNPFENNELEEYDGKYVAIEGEFNPYWVFVIEKIEVLGGEVEFESAGFSEEKFDDSDEEEDIAPKSFMFEKSDDE